MLDCDRRRIYVGVSTDVDRRLAEHRRADSRGARFTRGCRELELIYAVCVGGRALAQRVEYRLKKLPARTKRRLARERIGLHGLLAYLELDPPADCIFPV